MRLSFVMAMLLGLSVQVGIAAEPTFRSLAARTAYRQYQQDLAKAEATYRASVKKLDAAYGAALQRVQIGNSGDTIPIRE